MTSKQVKIAVHNDAFSREELPESIPTVDEWPQADTSDLERAYQYQSTIDAQFES